MALIAAARAAPKNNLAVLSSVCGVSWTYAEMLERSNKLAAGLSKLGYRRGDALVADLPNVPDNLLLQLACAQLGTAFCTTKDATTLDKLIRSGVKVRGAMVSNPASKLKEAMDTLRLSKMQLEQKGKEEKKKEKEEKKEEKTTAEGTPYRNCVDLPTVAVADGEDSDFYSTDWGDLLTTDPPASGNLDKTFQRSDDEDALSYFNTTSPLRHGECRRMGSEAYFGLHMLPSDRVCVSITLSHAFGIASAVQAAFVCGAAVVLPAVGGIRGCGDPKQRAEATLRTLDSDGCTLLFADSHTLAALPPAPASLIMKRNLRGGLVKIGSGSDIMPHIKEAKIGGVVRKLEYAVKAYIQMYM
eukprot:g11713.t1